MTQGIKDKVIVITGASSGLGEATARYLTAESGSVVLGARRLDRLQALANDINGRGGKALAMVTDVTAGDGHDTRSIQDYLGHKNIQHTVRYTELSPMRFKDFWRD
jgi:NADP-dependent 3-hydroxy acid dehydrogenase YdfG